MALITISPLALQRELLALLPEILGDTYRHETIMPLRKLLKDSTSLIIPILDCLNSLELDDDSLVRRNYFASLLLFFERRLPSLLIL